MHCVDRQVVVEVQGKQMKLEVLAVLEFNSDRKRMSILCRLPDGRSAPVQKSTAHCCCLHPVVFLLSLLCIHCCSNVLSGTSPSCKCALSASCRQSYAAPLLAVV